MLKKKVLLPMFVVMIIFGITPGWAKTRIVVYPEINQLCLRAKSGLVNYYLEEGQVTLKTKKGERKAAVTQKGCFTAPANLCSAGKKTELTFYPEKLYQRYRKTIPINLEGKKVWRKKSASQSNIEEAVYCFPSRNNRYPGDNFAIKINNFAELNRLLNAIPYVANVITNDPKLIQVIKPYLEGCPSGDITCEVVKSYAAVTKNLSYKSDPDLGGRDYIRTPYQTLKNKGGDCEDLTGVLVSFLANLGVDSYVLMTTDHAYAMACDVDPEMIKAFNREGLEREISRQENISINYRGMEVVYYGITGVKPGEKIRWRFNFKSLYPLSLLVLPGKVSSYRIKKRNFNYSPECSRFSVTEADISCESSPVVTLVFSYGVDFSEVKDESDRGINSASLTILGKYNLADLNDVAIHFYKKKKNGKDTYCVVLEPSSGANGYPGYSRVKSQWSIAINPVTWEWFYLKNR